MTDVFVFRHPIPSRLNVIIKFYFWNLFDLGYVPVLTHCAPSVTQKCMLYLG